MARDLIVTSDIIAGEGHALGYPDTKNQYLREIWADFTQEHEISGAQKAPYEHFAIPEGNTYTGTGTALTVSFTHTTFTEIILLLLWGTDDGELYLCTTAGQTQKASDGSVITDGVTALDTDGFTIGTNANLNTNTNTYYYFVIAMGTTPDSGSNASPPTWIADGTACLGGAASTMANDVEDDLDTKFLVKHTIDTGAHDDSEFDDYAKANTGTFEVDGTSNQTVTLSNTNLNIQHLWLWDAATFIAFKGENLARLRNYTTTALGSPGFVALGTGSFQIDGTKMKAANTTILDINSDTTDGNSYIENSASSSVDIRIVNPAGGAMTPVYHSTDQAHTGATSLKFDGGTAITGFWVYSDALDLVGDFLIEFELFINATPDNANETYFFKWVGYSSGVTTSIQIEFVNTAGSWTLKATIVDDTDTTTTISSTTDISTAAWHNFQLIRTSGFIELKREGSAEGSASLSTAISGMYALQIIKPTGGASVTAWYLDDLQIDVQQRYFETDATIRYVAIGED